MLVVLQVLLLLWLHGLLQMLKLMPLLRLHGPQRLQLLVLRLLAGRLLLWILLVRCLLPLLVQCLLPLLSVVLLVLLL